MLVKQNYAVPPKIMHIIRFFITQTVRKVRADEWSHPIEIIDVITYPCPDLNQSLLLREATGVYYFCVDEFKSGPLGTDIWTMYECINNQHAINGAQQA